MPSPPRTEVDVHDLDRPERDTGALMMTAATETRMAPGAITESSVVTAAATAVAQTTTIVATVTKIDRKHQSVTLRGADGTTKTVDVRNPAHLAKLEVGDLVELNLTQALAIQVEKAPKRSW
jgi:hypothetical protein